MSMFSSALSNGLGYNSLKDMGKGLAGHFLTDVLDRTLGAVSHTGPYGTLDGDMRRQKAIVKAALRLMYSQGWQWTVEVDGFADFQMFAKDITYTPVSIQTEAKKIGGAVVNRPTERTVETVVINCRDTGDMKIKKWFTGRANRVINPNGTINVPAQYLMGLRIYSLKDDGSTELADQYEVYPTMLGDVTRSRDQVSEFMSYPVTFTIYSSFSGVAQSAITSMATGAIQNVGKSIIGSVETQVKNLIKF